MRGTFIAVSLVVTAVLGFGQQVQDPGQLIGKKVVVQRMPLCEPGTFNTVLSYAGKLAVVLSAKPSKMLPAISESMLSRMPSESRALIEDQQKAATVVVQFEDGKKLDTCAAIGPSRISQYFELAEGETLTPVAAAPPNTVASPKTAAVDTLSNDELKAALAGKGKDHYVQINDGGLMAAQGALGTLPHITLFMPDAIIAIKQEQAKKQFLAYEPSEEDRKRFLTIFAQGYIGSTYQEGCVSVTRVVLLSSPSGEVVEEAFSSEPGSEAWANAFGATNYCQWLRVRFPLSAVRRVQAAAKDGEFYIAVFAGTRNTKTYKIKHKHQKELGLD
jgi:hypothetical protein